MVLSSWKWIDGTPLFFVKIKKTSFTANSSKTLICSSFSTADQVSLIATPWHYAPVRIINLGEVCIRVSRSSIHYYQFLKELRLYRYHFFVTYHMGHINISDALGLQLASFHHLFCLLQKTAYELLWMCTTHPFFKMSKTFWFTITLWFLFNTMNFLLAYLWMDFVSLDKS